MCKHRAEDICYWQAYLQGPGETRQDTVEIIVLRRPKFIPCLHSYLCHLERLPFCQFHVKHIIPQGTSILQWTKFIHGVNELMAVRNNSPIFLELDSLKNKFVCLIFLIEAFEGFLKSIL